MLQPDAHEEMRYQSNHVTTTKYNVVTFLPRSLYEQFTRLGNVYFLLVAVLSTTELSPVAPFTCILPLIAVLTISLVKEGVEDWHRAKSDHAVNRALVLVRREGKFVPKPWMEVRVGELVKVSRNSYFPADLLFLWSANPEGTCHVETMNLDGETNLKIKTAVEPACKLAEEEALKVAGSIEGDPPNNGIYTFNGALTLDNGEVVPLDPCNLLLRGSSLRNTETVLGMVVYTGARRWDGCEFRKGGGGGRTAAIARAALLPSRQPPTFCLLRYASLVLVRDSCRSTSGLLRDRSVGKSQSLSLGGACALKQIAGTEELACFFGTNRVVDGMHNLETTSCARVRSSVMFAIRLRAHGMVPSPASL